MAIVVDSSLWIDFFRSETPHERKRVLAPHFDRSDLCLLEPIAFELLRAAPKRQRRRVQQYLATVPVLRTPPRLWRDATALGQRCVDGGTLASPMDLLIAQGCIHHDVLLLTGDADFSRIADCSPLQVNVLRP